jgi:HD superfamily phosphohydrolase
MTIGDAVPEIAMLGTGTHAVRIPPDLSVPLTRRVRALIDTPAMRRLSRVSQLGLVSLVYPGAVHTRFEHSLGVYRLALEFLGRLRHDKAFSDRVSPADAKAFVVAALVHDIGHWAFCHPIEDIRLEGLPAHESLVHGLVTHGEVADVLSRQWGVSAERVSGLIGGEADDPAGLLLSSLLSGPVDVDKMDYLARDSLHAGVPYGRHFDEERLLSSLRVAPDGRSLGISEKGRAAAEMLVTARTVMFSEVYWHHTVRAATAMLQRAVWLVRDRIMPEQFVRFDDREFTDWILAVSRGAPGAVLAEGLFGERRRLLKRVASFDSLERPDVHRRYSGRPYAAMERASHRLAAILSSRTGVAIEPDLVVIDAPPVAREVEFRLPVERQAAGGVTWHRLEDVSPLVRALAHEQFDNVVKRVRIFCPADAAMKLAADREKNEGGFDAFLAEAALEAADS